jgi:hypothetical protein
MKQSEAFRWLVSVSEEFDAARAALALAVRRSREAANDRELDAMNPAHLARAADNLEATYIVRLFAEFAAVLRDYWAVRRPGRRTPAQTLVQRIGELQNIPVDWITDAHRVRDTRNDIVHHRTTTVAHSYQECRSWLGRFLSMLPQRW